MPAKQTSPTSGSRGRPRDPARVERVIDAAKRAFLADGFERTSVDAIARDSGISKVTIYNYFPTKRALYAAAMQSADRVEQVEFAPVRLDPGMPKEGLRRIARQFLKFQRDDATLSKHRTIYAEGAAQPEVALAFYQQGPSRKMSQVAGYLRACSEAGSLSVRDPDLAAEQFLCLFFGRGHVKALLGLGKPTAAEDESLVRSSVDLFLCVYGLGR